MLSQTLEHRARKQRTSEWINRYKHLSNIRVDFAILPPLFEILVYAFVADGREQSHIRHASLLLLESLLPIGLYNII